MYYQKLVGEEIYLSPMDLDNEVKIMTAWCNEDTDIAYYNGFYSSLLSEEKVSEMMMKWQEGPYSFSIVSKEDNQFLGHISLFNLDAHELTATMGIYLGKKYRHKGYGKEAIRLLLEYAFAVRRFTAIHLEVFSYNTHALKTYKQLGFVECGVWHQARYHQGKYHDIILMEYLRETKKP